MTSDMITAIAAIISAIAAILAVFIGIVSLVFTRTSIRKQEEHLKLTIEKQEEHNRNSVRPIGEIRCTDYEDKISVYLYNAGTGPMLINEILCKNEGNSLSTPNLVSLLPKVNQSWTTFTGNVKDRAITSGSKIVLAEINPISDDIKYQIRRALCDITISIKYTDVYETPFEKVKNSLFSIDISETMDFRK